jgi:hypothetical protein
MRLSDLHLYQRSVLTFVLTPFAVVLTLTLLGPAAVAQSMTVRANGAFATVVGCVDQPVFECFDLEVYMASLNGQQSTFLRYEHFLQDLNTGSVQDDFGFGTIPSSAFKLQGQNYLLNVDTTNVVDFYNLSCRATCDITPGGIVTGTWTKIGGSSGHSTGTIRLSSRSGTELIIGTQDFETALASGNILGMATVSLPGQVGTNHNTTITVTH